MRRSRRTWGVVLGTIVALSVLSIALVVLLEPLPPRELTLATGPPGTAFARMGERFQTLLQADGIRVRLRPTAGAIENLALLDDPRSSVSAGFVLAGTTTATASPELASLGAVSHEVLWFFCRCAPSPLAFHNVIDRRISIGPEGSGSRAVALQILKLNGVDPSRLQLLALLPEDAAQQLLAGSIDAMVVVSSWDAPVVRRLLADPAVNLIGFPRADAYVALLPQLEKIVIPMGVGNLALNRPETDVTVLRTKASLAVRRSLHPALQYLLVRAARDAASQGEGLDLPGTFPAALALDLPLSEEAQSYYRSGPSLLQRHLPFWLAELVTRILFGLLPVVGVLYPVWSMAPRAYSGYMQWRIYRHYLELRKLEAESIASPDRVAGGPLARRLTDLERRVASLNAPTPFAAQKYQLLAHIRQVADRVASASA